MAPGRGSLTVGIGDSGPVVLLFACKTHAGYRDGCSCGAVLGGICTGGRVVNGSRL